MPAALTLFFYAFASLCLGLIAASVIPVSLASALVSAFGPIFQGDMIVKSEQVLLGLTAVTSLTFFGTALWAGAEELWGRTRGD